MYVNLGRALPDVRDGLKPVQRRIIHAMDELGGRAGRPYQKSALTVGHVIGNYHPHGDSAVYDAMVRMAQGFVLNVPLVDGQGNWGSVGPKEYSDPPAAYRYTEARLSPAATAWLADLRPEIVPEYKPNFTEKKQEPWVLPVTFPNLLVNGSRGIGWSMACEIPPHNLAEACAAAIMLAENPDTTLEDILTVMPGPDFPTGGILVDPSALPEAYAKGTVIEGLDLYDGEDCKTFHAGTALSDGNVVTSGGRVLCVTALGASVAEAQARAYRRCATIAWEGGFYRRDIGYRAVRRERGEAG